MKKKTTLFKAYAMADRSTPMIWLFRMLHLETVDPIVALKIAWANWMDTDEGKEYRENNGENFGDSLNIPNKILAEAGICNFEQLNEFGGTKTSWDQTITIDHDENVVNLG